MKKYIGIDLGGTNCRVAVVDENGNIGDMLITPSYADQSSDVIVNNIIHSVKQIADYSKYPGIGIGVPGPVDQKNGWMTMASNIPALEKYPLISHLSNELGLPVFMDNDANVAGLAEAILGAGKDYDNVVYITHSTGIGGGIIYNKQIISGIKGYAGEVANIVIDPNLEKINHLNAGAIENHASGTALVKKAQLLIDKNITSAKELFDLYADKNPEACKIIDTMCYQMGLMLANIAHVLNPECFVFGGGVTKSCELYFDKMIDCYKSLVHPPMADTKFVLAGLKEPGIVGAALIPYSKGV